MSYSENDWRNYLKHAFLEHHGIMGQKWGIRNGPPYPLDAGDHSASEKKAGWKQSLTKFFKRDDPATSVLGLTDENDPGCKRIKESSYANLEKWGNDKNHNVLYMTGISGSGKSTAALYLAKKKNAEYINLDSYLAMMSEESRNELQNKAFNNYLDRNVKNWRNVTKGDKLNYKVVDQIANALDDFGAEQYGRGKKVIAEGIQVSDETLHEDRSYYSDKPVMLINTNAIASNYRGSVRDSETLLDFADLMLYRTSYSVKSAKNMKEFKNDLEMKHYDDMQ